jgi:hypothetical protein
MNHLFTILCLLLLAFRAQSAEKPELAITLEQFKLVGQLSNSHASFTLTGIARVEGSRGGELGLLRGPVALTDANKNPKWRLKADETGLVIRFERGGSFPIRVQFEAAVCQSNGWNEVDFGVAPSTLQPISLRGLPSQTQIEFKNAAKPEYHQSEFESFLAGDGKVNFRWKETQREGGGKLFYAAESLSQISVSPGLLRQVALFDFKVMQGELNSVTLLLRGPGEITRIQGDQVLAWNLEEATNSSERRLIVKFNQPQKDRFALQIQTQTPLAAFPQTADVVQLRPESATRFAGYFRIVNDGAVRLEVLQASGLSQISPEQFPETDLSRALLAPTSAQRFAYRFSGPDFALRIQADQILPELSVSEILSYHLGETELAIEGEFELEIREAPVRELTLRVPRGYSVAQLNAQNLSDYFLHEPDNQAEAELRLVFGQPVSGRQLVQLRLERNKPLGDASWQLPRIDIAKAKSVRGQIATSADAGFRLSPERTSSLTEIASAFFSRKVSGIQSAFRLTDAAWQAVVRVERLPQTVQADVLHLFSIGEGIAYGSSVINYTVSGAPLSTFKIDLSDEYFNVEFTGKDIRNWQKVQGGYQVQLHTPVSGIYTLLATYERPFKAQGETLTFTGARPLDPQSEQGHTLVISAYQFKVTPAAASAGLLPLEPGEVPAEYRLLFDAPILAAYRYSTRPFDLKLALSPLAQGDSLSLVVDRATLTTRISKEGQVLTEGRYFIKNRGHPHLRLTLPAGMRLWSATVNGTSVVPVADANANLIPLPAGGDPNAVVTLDIKLASVSKNPAQVAIAAPIINAPVTLAEWRLAPDARQRLIYRRGTLTPAGGEADDSGFAQLGRLVSKARLTDSLTQSLPGVALIVLGLIALKWASGTSSRWNPRHVTGLAMGVGGLVMGIVLLNSFADQVQALRAYLSRELVFLEPVQQAGGALSIEVLNVPDTFSVGRMFRTAWPVLLILPVWLLAWVLEARSYKSLLLIAGWALLSWVALRAPNGGALFLLVIVACLLLHLIGPILVRAWRSPPPRKDQVLVSGASAGTASAALAFLAAGCFLTSGKDCHAGSTPTPPTVMPELISQEFRIQDKVAVAVARIRWHAEKGQVLPALLEPAVLTRMNYPVDALRLERKVIAGAQAPSACATNEVWGQQLTALKKGQYEIEFQYQVPVVEVGGETGIFLPIQPGLVNRLNLTLVNMDAEIFSPQAVSVRSENGAGNTVAEVALSATQRAWISWKPRSRDVKHEKPVFYLELSQLYVPTAGVIEGVYLVSLRLAQGELTEVILDIPPAVTITDVVDASSEATNAGTEANSGSVVSLWRFDPDARKLRVSLSAPQARSFALLIRGQSATGPLPLDQSVGLLSVQGAAEQIGRVGLATGNEVQLDAATPNALEPINLEDFPPDLVARLQSQVTGLTLRRAFRYSRAEGSLSLKASAVEPDVRVESQDTVSLGEDRTVLAANLAVTITRAGIFRLSFRLPAGFDVESISGAALSHWTDLKSDTNRFITLHLNGKTEGRQQFTISLAGPGVRSTNGWTVPQLELREASKETGTLLLVPEQGLRLQVANSGGLTQLDPQKAGIKQKGVLAFRVLQSTRSLALNLEQVDAWVQVNSLQHATVGEAQIKVAANLQYQIENTGLKSLHVLIATNAEAVKILGDQIADFLPVPASITNGSQAWEIKLRRRVIGPYLLQITYQLPVPENTNQISLRGVQAVDVNLQRGFVTIQAGGRLQVRADSIPTALQAAEWQSIPRALQQGLPAGAANFSYRLVEADFTLPLHLERYQAAQMLPGRVSSITFNSVISDEGVMLTQARLEMVPGEKRLLRMALPRDARFWFAFVNQNGVWPWREQDQILIPLEQGPSADKLVPVELFYSCKIGEPGRRSLNLELLAPKFDLPLENITWRVSLSDKWELNKWSGSLQLQRQELIPQHAALDVQNYLQNETLRQQERTKKAEEYLAAANSALVQGDPQQARRAFQSAYGLSTHDAAFNEDARVQLHNIKLQEALVGLNVRQAASAGEGGALSAKVRELRDRKVVNYSQQEAKDILERNSSDENAAFMKLAERLIQQQDAAASVPAALHASIPDQGRLFTFTRAVLVDPWAPLRIELRTGAAMAAGRTTRASILATTFLLLAAIISLGSSRTIAKS